MKYRKNPLIEQKINPATGIPWGWYYDKRYNLVYCELTSHDLIRRFPLSYITTDKGGLYEREGVCYTQKGIPIGTIVKKDQSLRWYKPWTWYRKWFPKYVMIFIGLFPDTAEERGEGGQRFIWIPDISPDCLFCVSEK